MYVVCSNIQPNNRVAAECIRLFCWVRGVICLRWTRSLDPQTPWCIYSEYSGISQVLRAGASQSRQQVCASRCPRCRLRRLALALAAFARLATHRLRVRHLLGWAFHLRAQYAGILRGSAYERSTSISPPEGTGRSRWFSLVWCMFLARIRRRPARQDIGMSRLHPFQALRFVRCI